MPIAGEVAQAVEQESVPAAVAVVAEEPANVASGVEACRGQRDPSRCPE